MRRQRSSVEDRWTKTVYIDRKPQKVPSGRDGVGKRWRARYVDDHGREHSKMFDLKHDAQEWLNTQTSSVVTGTHVAPRDAQMTVQQWCDEWIEGYKINRPGSIRVARTQIGVICAEFGDKQLMALRPSQVKKWCSKLKEDGHEASYIYVLHGRLKQILGDAVYDGVLGRNPCSTKTSPPKGKQKPYVMTTEQLWALHDVVPENLQAAILLGAFAGLRVGEVSGLRVSDVNFMVGIVHPKQQWRGAPLKTAASDAPVPVPQDLALLLSASVAKFGGDMVVTNKRGKPCGPWIIEEAISKARTKIDLPEGFVFHDLRHYLASLLIASGADIKTVQARLRHELASTTLDTYSHLWPDADESTRTALGKVVTARLAGNMPESKEVGE
jgi:integrase